MLLESVQDLSYLIAGHEHPIQLHQDGLSWCFRTFERAAFKQNLSGIEKQEVTHFEKIPKALQSASVMWLVHLYSILDYKALEEPQNSQVMNFFDTHILYWIECMALLRKLDDAVNTLKQIERSLYVGACISLKN
jgi:hypothetical protein